MHEHIPRHISPLKGSSNRNFGLVFTCVFLCVGFLPLLDNLKIRFWALAIAVIFLLITAFADNVLAPLNRLWAKFGFLLHLIVSPLTLGVIFFLVVMPIGLLMRLFGKDFLHVNIDKSATTYWVERTPVDPESFKNQF